MKHPNKIYFIVVLLLILQSCSKLEKQKTIKLAHGLEINHPVHKAMVFMGDALEKKSKGALKLEVYPNNQLGSERQCLKLLQIGSLGMTKVYAAVRENFSPDMKVFGMPFLFRDKKHVFSVLDGAIGNPLICYMAV